MRPSCFETPPREGGGAACASLILAAGKGTRMKSDMPKVLHTLGGRPLLAWVLAAARDAGLGPQLVVVGHQAERVKEEMSRYDEGDLRYVLQAEQHGTGHAVQVARQELLALGEADVLILAGDVPLIRPQTLRGLLAAHREAGVALTLLSAEFEDPTGYGRILREPSGDVVAIREHRDASEAERAVREINAGIYCFRAPSLLEALDALRPENDQGEYYLTDTLAILRARGQRVAARLADDPREIAGINDREQLAALEAELESRGD
ncbi:NTP transferase domain-containing protein [bacterium]|nr:NTP transferase domain-containing protein [bacterium]